MERSKILEKCSLNIWNQDEMDSYEKLNPQRHTKLKSFNDKEIKSITSHPLGDAHRGSSRWGPPISKKNSDLPTVPCHFRELINNPYNSRSGKKTEGFFLFCFF